MQQTVCIACGRDDLFEVISLGEQCPANDLLDSLSCEYEQYPLSLNACRSCGHGQLSYFVEPSKLFGNYTYVSSTSSTMRNYMLILANFVMNLVGPEASLLEIGSNDGLFIKSLNSIGLKNTVGIDPASDIVNKSISEGVNSVVGFWPEDRHLVPGDKFDVVIGQNVFAHTGNPLESLLEVKNSLSEDGFAIFQTSQADMTANGEFDTIYHEHISFFSESSMQSLASRCGLKLIYTRYVDMHGTSSLYIMKHQGSKDNVDEIFSSATKSGLINIDITGEGKSQRYFRSESDWIKFRNDAIDRMSLVSNYVRDLEVRGTPVVAVGAAAKAITFLRACNIVPSKFLDESPLKTGKFIPGLEVKISDFSEISQGEFYLITAWNFAPEIATKLIKNGANPQSQCMVYFPEVRCQTLHELAF